MTPHGPDRRDPPSDLMVDDAAPQLYDYEAADDLDTAFVPNRAPEIEVLVDPDPVVVLDAGVDAAFDIPFDAIDEADADPQPASSLDVVDPRIRARRDAVVEERMRRRRLSALVAIAVATVLVATLVVLESTPFRVHHIDVDGASGADAAAIRRAAGVGGGDAVWRLDTWAVERRIAAVPWVSDVHVSRSLPNRVHVTVTRRIPVAWARSASGVVAVVDGQGRVISEQLERPPGLPELLGAAPAPPPGHDLSSNVGPRLVAVLPTALASRTATVSVAPGAVNLQLVFGPEVRLGPPERLEEKVLVAMAVLDALQGEWVPWVDVSVPTAPYAAAPTTTTRPAPPSTTTTAPKPAASPASPTTTKPTTTPPAVGR